MLKLESKRNGLEPEKSNFFFCFLDIGIILLVFKIERNNQKEKDVPNRNTGWSDMPLFNDFKILVETLFGLLFLSGFNAKKLETLVLSVGLIKITIFFWKN